ncbi:MAG: TonB family protein [Deltaproteobacteria bacterium]|nr:TonB family protein [Deltaproteobacteria bacterium]
MPARHDSAPFVAALALSLTLHAAMVFLVPGGRVLRSRPTQDLVVVELAPPTPSLPEPVRPPDAAAQPAEEAPAAPPPPTTQPAAPSAAPPLRSEAPSPPSPPAGDRAGTAAPGAALAPISPAEGGSAPAVQTPARATPSLRALLPTGRDIASFRAPSGRPDPAAGNAREATLGLGDEDERYRGYRDQVWSAIYNTWRVGKALVVAGGSRTVLVRLTIDDTGLVQDAHVVEGSGNPTLDAEALEAVRRARIPPFPPHWTIQRLHLMAQFDYLFR